MEFRLQTAQDVVDLLQEQVAAVRSEQEAGTLEKARAVGYLAGIALKAIDAQGHGRTRTAAVVTIVDRPDQPLAVDDDREVTDLATAETTCSSTSTSAGT